MNTFGQSIDNTHRGTTTIVDSCLTLQNDTGKGLCIKSSDNQSEELELTLPSTNGTSGQVLSTNGQGITSWIPNGSGGGSAGDILDGGQSGPISVGTTDGTSMTLLTTGAPRMVINSSGQTTFNNSVEINGVLNVAGLPSNSGSITLADADNSHSVTLKAADVTVGSYTLTLPNNVGSSGQILSTSNGTGGLEWVDQVAGGDVFNGGQSSGSLILGTQLDEPFQLIQNNRSSMTIVNTGIFFADTPHIISSDGLKSVGLARPTTGNNYLLTLPDDLPSTSGFVLTSTDGGVCSWTNKDATNSLLINGNAEGAGISAGTTDLNQFSLIANNRNFIECIPNANPLNDLIISKINGVNKFSVSEDNITSSVEAFVTDELTIVPGNQNGQLNIQNGSGIATQIMCPTDLATEYRILLPSSPPVNTSQRKLLSCQIDIGSGLPVFQTFWSPESVTDGGNETVGALQLGTTNNRALEFLVNDNIVGAFSTGNIFELLLDTRLQFKDITNTETVTLGIAPNVSQSYDLYFPPTSPFTDDRVIVFNTDGTSTFERHLDAEDVIVQGGNEFATTFSVGSLDNHPTHLISNGVKSLSIDPTNNHTTVHEALCLEDDDENCVILQAPSNIAVNYAITLPPAAPTAIGQVLVAQSTNGTVDWQTLAETNALINGGNDGLTVMGSNNTTTTVKSFGTNAYTLTASKMSLSRELVYNVQTISDDGTTPISGSSNIIVYTFEGNVTTELPSAQAGTQLTLVKKGSIGTLTVNAATGDNIQGDASVVLSTQWDRVVLVSIDLSTWITV